jgi:hypothetical protein
MGIPRTEITLENCRFRGAGIQSEKPDQLSFELPDVLSEIRLRLGHPHADHVRSRSEHAVGVIESRLGFPS